MLDAIEYHVIMCYFYFLGSHIQHLIRTYLLYHVLDFNRFSVLNCMADKILKDLEKIIIPIIIFQPSSFFSLQVLLFYQSLTWIMLTWVKMRFIAMQQARKIAFTEMIRKVLHSGYPSQGLSTAGPGSTCMTACSSGNDSSHQQHRPLFA